MIKCGSKEDNLSLQEIGHHPQNMLTKDQNQHNSWGIWSFNDHNFFTLMMDKMFIQALKTMALVQIC